MNKTLVISEDTHLKLKKYCQEKKIKINDFVTKLIENEITIDENELPSILRNKDGVVVETITCTELSSEIKNNMPKSLTLIKRNKDGSGHIGNYNLK